MLATEQLFSPKMPSSIIRRRTEPMTLISRRAPSRTCSLRERRTGADQRLERLPSGPPPGQKVLLWTIIKGPNTDKR